MMMKNRLRVGFACAVVGWALCVILSGHAADDITERADLAIAKREVWAGGGKVRGIVHNIGAKHVPVFTVAVVDEAGGVRASKRLGPLDAPLDMEPRRLHFELGVGDDPVGWRVVVDPEGEIPEIYEGNNECAILANRR